MLSSSDAKQIKLSRKDNGCITKKLKNMEEIIVGIDFSKGSECAIELAIDMANKMRKNIKLVYVVSPSGEEMPIEEIGSKINDLITKYADKLIGGNFKYEVVKGKVSEKLSLIAKEEEASYVVVGTHGTSGYEKDWIGRNAYKTIEETECPVLTIRENFNFNKDLENIVVPIDSSMETRQKMPYVVKIAKLFKSTVRILGLYTSESIITVVDKYIEQVEKYLTNFDIPYTVEKTACENITTATLEYADSIKADMVVIMTEQEKSFSNLVIGSYAQQMIHHSMIPVLTIRPEEINSASR